MKTSHLSHAGALAVMLIGTALAEEKPAANAVAVPATASSTPGLGRFGLGAILGEPTGLSAKMWLSEKTAVDAGLAYSFDDPASFHLHGDFLFHNFDLLPVAKGQCPVYFGVGGRVKFERRNDSRAGVRFPVGVAYMFANTPVDVFAEVAPILDLSPKTRLAFNGAIGIRYFFGR